MAEELTINPATLDLLKKLLTYGEGLLAIVLAVAIFWYKRSAAQDDKMREEQVKALERMGAQLEAVKEKVSELEFKARLSEDSRQAFWRLHDDWIKLKTEHERNNASGAHNGQRHQNGIAEVAREVRGLLRRDGKAGDTPVDTDSGA